MEREGEHLTWGTSFLSPSFFSLFKIRDQKWGLLCRVSHGTLSRFSPFHVPISFISSALDIFLEWTATNSSMMYPDESQAPNLGFEFLIGRERTHRQTTVWHNHQLSLWCPDLIHYVRVASIRRTKWKYLR